jgi:hypothetical protein
MRRALVTLLIGSVWAMGSVTYRLSENAAACSEVRIPAWTRPAGSDDPAWQINTWGCEYDVRTQGQLLYLGLSCGGALYWRMMEKYAVDLRHPEGIRKIGEAMWDTASVQEPTIGGVWADSPRQQGDANAKFRNRVQSMRELRQARVVPELRSIVGLELSAIRLRSLVSTKVHR